MRTFAFLGISILPIALLAAFLAPIVSSIANSLTAVL